jgi:hypothetical protein
MRFDQIESNARMAQNINARERQIEANAKLARNINAQERLGKNSEKDKRRKQNENNAAIARLLQQNENNAR